MTQRKLHRENYTDIEKIAQRNLHRKTHRGKYMKKQTK